MHRKLRNRLPSEPRFFLFGAQPARSAVDDAERSGRVSVFGYQQRVCVKANMRRARYEPIVSKRLVFSRVRDKEKIE